MAGMSSQPAEAGELAAAPLILGLLDDILVWEILLRLPPRSILRCRAVSPAWRRATSTRRFLLAHHARQPALPIVCESEIRADHLNIFSFDGHLQPVARFEENTIPMASCDGMLILLNYDMSPHWWYSVCNLATRQHAPLRQLSDFKVLGMYAHRPTGENRLLLQPIKGGDVEDEVPQHQIGGYVFALGSDQPLRYIGAPDATLPFFSKLRLTNTALLHDCLHWHPVDYQTDPQQYSAGSKVVVVFDTTSESFRQMRAPHDLHGDSFIFEMDATFGLYSCCPDMETVNIWVLQDYQGEVWERKYNVKLPVVEIREQFKLFELDGEWDSSIVSVDGAVLVMVTVGPWLFYIDTKGKLVDNFHHHGQHFKPCRRRLKQSLVPHTFFTALEGYAVNASPFV